MKFDIVGDIHGHADALERLLINLGYQPSGKGYRQDGHTLVLVGDLIDRGPGQRRVVEIAQAMRDAGDALVMMGNHEFNAICFAMESAHGGYIRPHSESNVRQHQAFLDEFPFGSDEYQQALAFFKSLPLWLELDAFRAIHACWYEPAMALLNPLLDAEHRSRGDALFLAYDDESHPAYDAAETVLKGPEVALPDGVFFLDKDGHKRERARVKWWQLDHGQQHSFAVAPELLAEHDMSGVWLEAHEFRYPGDKPLFFGHYWQKDFESVRHEGQNAFCLDYSVARSGGQLVAASIDEEDFAGAESIRWSWVPQNEADYQPPLLRACAG